MTEREQGKPRGFQPGNNYGKGRPLGRQNALSSKDQFLKAMEFIYENAVSANNWHAAIRAKELHAKALGLFRMSKLPLPEIKAIKDMNEEQLMDFVARLEESDPDLKKLEVPYPTG